MYHPYSLVPNPQISQNCETYSIPVWHYPNGVDRSLNETVIDKIRQHLVDYNNNPLSTISCMSPIPSTSGRLHSDFVLLLFLQDHRETDRFFFIFRSSVCATRPWPVQYHRVVFFSQLKSLPGVYGRQRARLSFVIVAIFYQILWLFWKEMYSIEVPRWVIVESTSFKGN